MDDYVDLNTEQEEAFEPLLTKFMDWHRHTQLARYKQTIAATQVSLSKGDISEQELEQLFIELRSFWEDFRLEITPLLVDVAKLMSKEQVDALFAKLDEDNQELADKILELKKDDQYQAEKIKNRLSGIENWTGKLSKQQKNWLKTELIRYKTVSPTNLAYRKAWQAKAKGMIEQKQWAELGSHIQLPYQSEKAKTLIEIRRYNQAISTELYPQIWQKLTAKQKKKVISKLGEYVEDFESLIGSQNKE
ncbi:hypothetical protein HR060_04355 [Catenovulum sp. SM1970]|uniref:DUF6279 family lipoprotein n=1 Tax=Marinifaba aquimaris TaxID=2741323 RepID=UPI001572A994|nr:DUF6279 family lipoprotein [Marinifaba aquimaris]NTS76093.1 hypothetical protein [Marinifaba aquimaris]